MPSPATRPARAMRPANGTGAETGRKSSEASWRRAPVAGSTRCQGRAGGREEREEAGPRRPGTGTASGPAPRSRQATFPAESRAWTIPASEADDEERPRGRSGEAGGARGGERPEGVAAGRLEGGDDRARDDEQGAAGAGAGPAAGARVLGRGPGPEDRSAREVARLQQRAAEEGEQPRPRRRPAGRPGRSSARRPSAASTQTVRSRPQADDQVARPEQAVAGGGTDVGGGDAAEGDPAQVPGASGRGATLARAPPRRRRRRVADVRSPSRASTTCASVAVAERSRSSRRPLPAWAGARPPDDRAEVRGPLEDGLGEGERVAPDRGRAVHARRSRPPR